MENNYDVGIANRFALFLEEGESSLTAIKKKYSKELRAKNKRERKENAENKKAELVEPVEKPKPEVEETAPLKKEIKESKNEVAKGKEKKQNDIGANKRDKESQDKPRNVKNGEIAAPVVEENWDTDTPIKPVDVAPAPRKNYENRENRKPRDRKYENSDQYQQKSYSNQKRFNKDDSVKDDFAGDNTFDRYQTNQTDDGSFKENGHGPQSEYRPRGGRSRGSNRGGRGSYGGGDRRREFNNVQRNEPKEEGDTIKSDMWGEEKVPEAPVENTDNQNEEMKADNDGSASNEQKEEVKELLTLDEWKKLRGQREKPQYNLRKAGEGEDLSQWKNMRELQKEKQTEFLENGYNSGNTPKKNDSEKENAGNENVQRATRQKHIDINIHFREPSTRGRGGRIIRSNRFGYKGRNEDRNERNEGGNGGYGGETRSFRKTRDGPPSGRGGNHRQSAPKMDDTHAFPSLGKSLDVGGV